MTTVWLTLRADVRRRWPALLSLALLLGLIGGVVLTAAAGARRTDTAYPRLLRWANATRFEIIPEGTGFNGYYGALARLPHIAAMTTTDLYTGLQQFASAGETVLSGATREVLSGPVPVTALPPRLVKGLETPVVAFKISSMTRAGAL